jgi:23S rRNA (uracil1939-C5)-methyltransferase
LHTKPSTIDPNQNCGHFFKKQCGGCSFLHVPYSVQLAAKQEKITSILNSAFRSLPSRKKPDLKKIVKSIVPSPSSMGYRTSAKFCLNEDKHGKKTVGLFTQGTKSVVSTTGCPANADIVNQLIAAMFKDLPALDLKFYDHSSSTYQKNRLKFLTVRTSPAPISLAEHAAVIMSHTGVDKQVLIQWMKSSGLQNLCVYESKLTKEDGEAFTSRNVNHVSGPETFPYNLNERLFQISPVSFFQANHSLAHNLIAYVVDFKQHGDVLLDLYGGFGAYSFAAKDMFKDVIVVDGNSAAIQAANKHAQTHGIAHLKAFSDTCENFLEKKLSLETARRITHLIVNPARTGMSLDVLKMIGVETMSHLKELHYVSCSPPTFARDALTLIDSGFTLTELVPFDMFPQADHVEIAAKFIATS